MAYKEPNPPLISSSLHLLIDQLAPAIPLKVSAMNGHKLHFVLVPLMAQGHTIPMIDMARLLASRGAHVTLVTTPLNASRISTIIHHVDESGLPVRFLILRFPCAEAGLPDGCENVDNLPSRALLKNFAVATEMLREPLLEHLRAHELRPSCIISDMMHPWTQEVAREFSIPRLVFHGYGCCPLLCMHNLRKHKVIDKLTHDNESFVVPGLPDKIELTKAQTPTFFSTSGHEEFRERMWEAESTADGVVVNSFDELELSYKEWYQKAVGKKAWTIGPLSLYSKNVAEMALRGNKSSIDKEQCLKWLDAMQPGSVVYVSFGSLALLSPAQLIEIGLGLEASQRPFVWVIKAGNRAGEIEEWLRGGFEERTKSRALIIRGWAPQVMILSHAAVGGFVTHCGWNSTLESVSAGVPMITWPQFGDQFINERLVVEVLRIGVAVGVEHPMKWGEETEEVFIKRTAVEKAVSTLMDAGEDGIARRKRANELGERARKAMEEGGSSYENLTHMIEEIHRTNSSLG